MRVKDGGSSTGTVMLWVCLAIMLGSAVFVTYRGLAEAVRGWITLPQYSHGFFIPVIAIFLLWQKRKELSNEALSGSWAGPLILLAGTFVAVLGSLSTITVIIQYAFLILLLGIAISLGGLRLLKVVWGPLVFLIFMIPLPQFLYQGLSAHLQLISSWLGVEVIRWFRIPVYLEGNVIDLGVYKLQVVEACSGLKYLFSLTSIGFLCAYIFKVPLWKRIVVFLSSIPITIFMNSFRIGVTGVMVEYGGIHMAEGFLHEFEGLVVFGFALAILFLEMALLARIGRHKTTLRDAFTMTDVAADTGGRVTVFRVPNALYVGAVIVILGAIGMQLLGSRDEVEPTRLSFAEFPDTIGSWHGQRSNLQSIYLDRLKLDDYILENYQADSQEAVNFYVAYYASQAAGASAHSPRSCIPGGGWYIKSLATVDVPGVNFQGKPLRVNRSVIEMGDVRQVVYYWFQQRGRDITNEYAVKWYIFWDALTRNRTDGALVRLTTVIRPGETAADGDARLAKFARTVMPMLGRYIPN